MQRLSRYPRYHAPIRALALVQGHPFDRAAFGEMLDSFTDVSVSCVDHPAAEKLLNSAALADIDTLILYDFRVAPADQPALRSPSEALQESLRAVLGAGIGIVALHHALAGWPLWAEYGQWLGGRFLYRPDTRPTSAQPSSGYRRNVRYGVSRCDPVHPVLEGVPDRFELTDELYRCRIDAADVTPLLRADADFSAARFESAELAARGETPSGELTRDATLRHPPASDLIAWTRQALASRVVYLQPGDAADTYAHPVYRRLLHNAIRWTAASRQR
jgi:uncharacterized protein